MTATFEPFATQYTVAAVPSDHPHVRYRSVVLERRSGERWVVKVAPDVSCFLDADGEWTQGSDVTDEWKAAHWHTWDVAVRLAQKAASEL